MLVPLVRGIRALAGITPEYLDHNRSIKRTPWLIEEYLRLHSSCRLHIGCQHHPMDGWLNADIQPADPRVAYMDATKPFPLPDASFDYVFSEHMIEHIGLEQGAHMLRESYRVLKPGGKIRIVTPDITLLQKLLQDPEQADHAAYIEFSMRYFRNPSVFNEVVVVNNFFRDWGHQFVYNEATLGRLFELAGFSSISRGQVGSSGDAVLNGLENHHMEITDRFNRMESLVMEAVK